MSLFSFFETNKKLETFVKQSLDQFCESLPVNSKLDVSDKKLVKKFDKAANRLKNQMLTYRKENRLGVYKKAKLISLTIEEMEERGYSQDIIDNIKEKVIVYLTN